MRSLEKFRCSGIFNVLGISLIYFRCVFVLMFEKEYLETHTKIFIDAGGSVFKWAQLKGDWHGSHESQGSGIINSILRYV